MHNFQNTIEIRGVVQPDMMKSGVGEIVLDAIYSAADDGARPSPDVVRAVLEERGQLTESCEELVEEAWDTGFSSNAVDRVAQTVTKQYTRRALHDFGKQLSDRASSNAMDPSELQEWAEQTLMHLSTKGRSASMRSMREVVDSTMERIQEAMDAEDGVVGVPSGLHAVDNITGGFQPGKLYLVAGRPGMGKSAYAGVCMRNSAKEGYGNLGFLLEMTAEGYAARQLGQAARVNSFRAEHGRISENELKSLTEGSRELEQLPIWLDDEPGLDLAEIKSRARKGVAQHDVDIVWIDYVQLIKNTANSREQEVAGISREMKGLAKSLDIPVVALAQLNRSVDKRGGDGRPKLSDLRDSGQLEQDADMVQFVYRAEQYGIEVDEHGNSTDGLGEIIVAKHRGGPLGTATLAWNADYAEFENLPEDEAAF
jgi:replicative DNA helicase